MPSILLLIGCAIFGASVFLVLALLVANGGANKSRQFAVLGDLLSGRNGALMRGLLIAALAGLAIGALIAFAAVERTDAARRTQCENTCVKRGFKEGTIRLSSSPGASGRRYSVCRCTGGPGQDEEIDLGKLSE